MDVESGVFNNFEKERAQIEDLEKRRRMRDHSDVRKVLSTPEGRRFVWRLLEFTGQWVSPFAGDVQRTHLNIGRGDVGRFIMDDLTLRDLTQMQEETKADPLRPKPRKGEE